MKYKIALFVFLFTVASGYSQNKIFLKKTNADGDTEFVLSSKQEKINFESLILDSVFNKISSHLSLEKEYNSYNKDIRIIDLTKKLSIKAGYFYTCQRRYFVCQKIPLNFNNGEHREIIVVKYKRQKNVVYFDIIYPIYEPNIVDIHNMINASFIFDINKNKISIHSFNFYEMDDWDGYLN